MAGADVVGNEDVEGADVAGGDAKVAHPRGGKDAADVNMFIEEYNGMDSFDGALGHGRVAHETGHVDG